MKKCGSIRRPEQTDPGDGVTHQIDKLHKGEACLGITVSAWVGNALRINRK